jgi:hypothetical protein
MIFSNFFETHKCEFKKTAGALVSRSQKSLSASFTVLCSNFGRSLWYSLVRSLPIVALLILAPSVHPRHRPVPPTVYDNFMESKKWEHAWGDQIWYSIDGPRASTWPKWTMVQLCLPRNFFWYCIILLILWQTHMNFVAKACTRCYNI